MKFFFLSFFILVGCGNNSSSNSSTINSISELLPKYNVPALGAAFMRNGVLEEVEVKGIRKFGSENIALSTDTFHLGSNTKAMTSTLAAIMIESGKLDWSSTLGELLPEINLHPDFKTMQFEDLLVHRGGFPVEHNDLFQKVLIMEPVQGRALITKTLLELPPLTKPGMKYLYSNFNYIIAGHILERLGQKSWEDLTREKIFSPLEMNSCGFGVTSKTNESLPSSVWAHVKQNGKIIPRHHDNPMSFGPASTVHCSLTDWSKFLSVHAKGWNGENSLVSSETFKKLHAVHASQDSNYTYGGWLLLNRSWANGPVLTHSGSNLMNYSNTWIAPKLNVVLMSTTNIGGEEAFKATDSAIQTMLSKNLP